MAIQKHNIYYDASKPESGIYYYAENGEQKELFLNNVLSGENGISAISAVDGNTWVIGITDDYKDNIEKIPGLSNNFAILSADVENKLYVSATDNWDVLPYTGSTNISIHDHIIDFQNTANLIGDDTYIAVVSAGNNIEVRALKDFVDEEYVDAAIASAASTSAVANKLDKAVFSAYSADIALQLNNISADKLDTSAFTAYSAHALDDYYKKTETSSKQEIQTALDEKQDNLTNEQLSAISSVSAIQSISANWLTEEDIKDFITEDEVESVSSTLTAQTNYLSGIIDTKLDTSTFTAYSATALDDYYKKSDTSGKQEIQDALDTKLNTSAFTAYSADVKTQIDSKLNKTDFDNYSAHALSDYYTKNETDVEITDAINDISATVSTDYLKKTDVQEYTAGNNIDITNYVISGRDWTPELNTKVNNSDFAIYSADVKTQIDSKLNKSDFDDYSAHALNDYYKKSETSGKTEIQNALDTKLNTSAFTVYSGNIDTLLNNISANTTALSANKLDTTAFNDYTATALDNYYTISETYTEITNAINDISATVSADYLKKADVREYTAGDNIDITNYVISGKDWTPELNTKVNNTDFNAYSASTKTQIDSKLNKTDFNTYSAHADTTPYSGINGIKVENHLISVSANYALSADVYSKSEVDNIRDNIAKELAGLGFYDCKSDEIKANGEPNETVLETRDLLSNNKIYLVKDNTAPVPDQYKEWIWDGTNWTCIGDTSISLVAYAKTQDVIASAIATSAWINDTFYDKTETSGKQQIQDALNTKLNTSIFTAYSADVKTQIDSKLNKTDFDNYSANALNDYYKKSETSGKTEIQNALNTKLDTTAFNDYTATALNDIAANSGNWNASYTALTANSGNWNNTYNTVTTNSGKWENSYTALTANSAAWLKEADVTGFATKTELNNASSILINQDNYLSGVIDTKLDTTAFNDYSAHALNDYYKKSETSGKTEIQNALGTKLDTSAFTAYSADVKTQIDSKLNKSEFNTYSAAVDNDIDYISAAVSSIPAQVQSDWEEINTASPAYIQNKPADLEMSAGNGISITETNNILIFAVSGNYADATEVNNKLTALSANKLDISATTDWDISAYSAGNNITIVDHVIDLRESKNLIGDGENIIVTESGSNIIVSALKDILDKDDFDSYSAIIDDDIDYLSAAIEDSILSPGTDLKIENGIISVNTNGIVENRADMSFVAGSATYASGVGAAAFGYAASAVDDCAFAEGYGVQAISVGSHAEGIGTKAIGSFSHTEGTNTSATNNGSHAEGQQTLASGYVSHSEGYQTIASGYASHAEGWQTSAAGMASHTEGGSTVALGQASHAEGNYTHALGMDSHSEGTNTTASGHQSHAEGAYTLAEASYTHTEGYNTSAIGYTAHAEGDSTFASGNASHTEGQETSANYGMAHAEGVKTLASGYASHTEGSGTRTNNSFAHAEGYGTSAISAAAHAEGWQTSAAGIASHAEGSATSAIGSASYAGGCKTLASGDYSHAEGQGTIAGSDYMHAAGIYNETTANALYVIGNGTADDARSDAFIVTSGGLVSAVILATSGISDVESAISSLSSNLDSYVKYTDIQYSIGSANTANGSNTAYSVALGQKNSAYDSYIIGYNNKGNHSHIFGYSNSGTNSYILGSTCTGTYSYLIGSHLSGKSWSVSIGDVGETFCPVIVGKNNATTTSAYFVVGAGTAFGDSKADAFIVSSNKIASAADFLAGNGVSLSSLTGLATTSWVNNTYATKSVAQQYANFVGGNGIVVAGDIQQTKTINSNLTEVPIQDGTGIHIYEEPNDAYVSISVKPEVFIYQTNSPVSRNTDGQFGITLQAGSYSTFNTKNGTVGVNNTDFTGLDANKLYNYNVKVGVTASSPGTVSLYGPNWNNSESHTSAYVSTNGTLELDCYIKGVTSFNVSGAGLNSNIGAGIIEASITEVCDV